MVLGLTFSLALGWLAIRGIDWGEVGGHFQEFPLAFALFSLALFLAACVLRAYRWRLLFLRDKPSLRRLFLVQNVGLGLNNLVPVRLFSEVVQFAILKWRYGVNGGTALATLGAERILDLVVTATLLMAGLTLLPNKGDFLPYVAGAFVVAVTSVVMVRAFVWASKKPLLNRINLLTAAAAFLSELARARGVLAYSLLLTLIYWLAVGICGWTLAVGMDLAISPFAATLALLGTLYFATSIPALPASVGTFEFAIVYVLRVFDVEQELAFSYAVVIHAILFLPPIIITLATLPFWGLHPLRPERIQEGQGDKGLGVMEMPIDSPKALS
jgi:uncharacterized membrane protein YbhN (UPF0104 family)